MSTFNKLFCAALLLVLLQQAATAQVVLEDPIVLEDQGVSLSQGELKYIVNLWTNQMKAAAANDEGDRLELLNKMLVIKKMAQEADKTPKGTDAYWRLSTTLMNTKHKLVLEEFRAALEIPDMSALAAERYETQKEKYAFVAEFRTSSHILFACAPGKCSRPEMKAEAQVVLDELRAGADFAEMVQVHSDDPGTKAKGGKFDKWMRRGEVGVVGPYSEGIFKIEQVGDYSEIVSTRFGIHILRLDGVRESHFLPYKEVKSKIVADLEKEYRRLSITDYNRSFNMTDDVYIDGAAMEQIFSPYKAKNE